MAEPILAIRDLSKSFGALKATENVSLDLRPGEIHALIGPNGAGKSTLIHQIAGTLKPDSGAIEFLGEEPVSHLGAAERARMGLGRSFPGLLARARILGAAQRDAGRPVAAGNVLPLLQAGDAPMQR
jgi:ABC-type branched-subunit amino acid transport system ATPase component